MSDEYTDDYEDEFEFDSEDTAEPETKVATKSVEICDTKCASCREFLTTERKKEIDSSFYTIKFQILKFVRNQLDELEERSIREKRRFKLNKPDGEIIDTVKSFISDVLHVKYNCKICELGPKNATRAREILGEHFLERNPIPSYYSYYKPADWLGKWGLGHAEHVKRDTLTDLHAFL